MRGREVEESGTLIEVTDWQSLRQRFQHRRGGGDQLVDVTGLRVNRFHADYSKGW